VLLFHLAIERELQQRPADVAKKC